MPELQTTFVQQPLAILIGDSMFVYYETDGDSGWYSVKLFTSRLEAEKYHKRKGDAYGHTAEIAVDDEVEAVKSSTIKNVKCPECDGEMISRIGQFGTFWGCKKYPMCKGTRNSDGLSREEASAERAKSREKEEARQDPNYRFNKS